LSPPTRKPRFKLRTKGIKEAFKDNRGYELDEEDVEQIFDILLNNKSSDKAEEPATGPAEPAKADNTEVLNKLKRTIRDTMTDEQRKALWRALNEI
jgi:hypothetical protein